MTRPGEHRFEVAASELVYDGAILALRVDDVVMPGGGIGRREVVEHHSAVAVVALDVDGRVGLIRQYRHPIGERLLELPAGLMDVPGEPAQPAAARELAEEIGMAAEHWAVLADVALSPGFCDETLRIFLATGLTAVDRPDPEDEEADLAVEWWPLADAVDAIYAGEVVNATAVAGLLAAAGAAGRTLRAADAPWRDEATALPRRHARRSATD